MIHLSLNFTCSFIYISCQLSKLKSKIRSIQLWQGITTKSKRLVSQFSYPLSSCNQIETLKSSQRLAKLLDDMGRRQCFLQRTANSFKVKTMSPKKLKRYANEKITEEIYHVKTLYLPRYSYTQVWNQYVTYAKV